MQRKQIDGVCKYTFYRCLLRICCGLGEIVKTARVCYGSVLGNILNIRWLRGDGENRLQECHGLKSARCLRCDRGVRSLTRVMIPPQMR